AAIGVGACARLAIEVGAAFQPPGARAADAQAIPLRVEARLDAAGAEVTLAAGALRAAGRGATPIEAIGAAVASLAPRLAPPPMSAEEIAAWGARDAAGARRIVRARTRMQLDIAPDDQAAARELLTTDPDSPWTHMIAASADLGGADGREAARRRVLELAGRLPRARALLGRGVTLARTPGASRDERGEALRILRQAYAEAPDDAEVAALVAYHVADLGGEEGFPVLDRLADRSPAQSVWAMMAAVQRLDGARDPDRDRRYIERLRAAFPESIAWHASIRYAVQTGDVAGARRAVETGLRFGMAGPLPAYFYAAQGRAFFHLVALEPAAAREIATRMLGVPRDPIALYGSSALIGSYLMEGRIDEARSIRLRERDRLRGGGQLALAAEYALEDLAERLLLGAPAPSADRLAWLEELAAGSKIPSFQATVRLAIALAAAEGNPSARPAALRALGTLEAIADRDAEGDRFRRDEVLVRTVPAVRRLRGKIEAAARWRETDRAPFRARRRYALEAGLALEASGDLDGAEQAYRLAADAEDIERHALAAMAARVRLADLYRVRKRDAEAAALDAEVARAWSGAEPGLRDGIRALR
ncbi:MAG: hypothetical protein IT372_29620, partial [Polyangiaceae bacterium]|nr:hypothetical protein [Polyangiaceae bacterium]